MNHALWSQLERVGCAELPRLDWSHIVRVHFVLLVFAQV